MTKNNQKEIINLSTLNKTLNIDEKPKINDNKNNIINISEDKTYKKDFLPKITLKKDNNNNSTHNNNILLNQKRERTESNKDKEEDNNNTEDKSININNSNKKRTTVNEAKKEMKEFELLILKTEKEIEKKYGIVFPDLSFEDNLPDEIKNKFIDDFLESSKIKKILTEATNNQK